MSRGSSPVKVREWTARLERFRRVDQTVVQFCQAEGVSTPSFYHWKKKLGGAAETGAADRPGRPKSAKPGRSSVKSPALAAFQPLCVSPLEMSSGVTIRLPNGIVMELGCDLVTIKNVVGQLLDRQGLERRTPAGAGSC